MRREYAAGGIVIKKERGRPGVLLIKDGYGRWTWPKGHPEEGETAEETALREVSEETGLVKLEMIGEVGRQEYCFRLGGETVFKSVTLFLMKADAREKLRPQREEVLDARWARPDEAIARIEYEGSAELLGRAISMFREKFIRRGRGSKS